MSNPGVLGITTGRFIGQSEKAHLAVMNNTSTDFELIEMDNSSNSKMSNENIDKISTFDSIESNPDLGSKNDDSMINVQNGCPIQKNMNINQDNDSLEGSRSNSEINCNKNNISNNCNDNNINRYNSINSNSSDSINNSQKSMIDSNSKVIQNDQIPLTSSTDLSLGKMLSKTHSLNMLTNPLARQIKISVKKVPNEKLEEELAKVNAELEILMSKEQQGFLTTQNTNNIRTLKTSQHNGDKFLCSDTNKINNIDNDIQEPPTKRARTSDLSHVENTSVPRNHSSNIVNNNNNNLSSNGSNSSSSISSVSSAFSNNRSRNNKIRTPRSSNIGSGTDSITEVAESSFSHIKLLPNGALDYNSILLQLVIPSRNRNRKSIGNETLSTVVTEIVRDLMTHTEALAFNRPVDPEKDGAPDYFDIVTKPMDLGTVRDQLKQGYYKNLQHFVEDVRQIWANAFEYNSEMSVICQNAKYLSSIFENKLIKLEQTIVQYCSHLDNYVVNVQRNSEKSRSLTRLSPRSRIDRRELEVRNKLENQIKQLKESLRKVEQQKITSSTKKGISQALQTLERAEKQAANNVEKVRKERSSMPECVSPLDWAQKLAVYKSLQWLANYHHQYLLQKKQIELREEKNNVKDKISAANAIKNDNTKDFKTESFNVGVEFESEGNKDTKNIFDNEKNLSEDINIDSKDVQIMESTEGEGIKTEDVKIRHITEDFVSESVTGIDFIPITTTKMDYTTINDGVEDNNNNNNNNNSDNNNNNTTTTTTSTAINEDIKHFENLAINESNPEVPTESNMDDTKLDIKKGNEIKLEDNYGIKTDNTNSENNLNLGEEIIEGKVEIDIQPKVESIKLEGSDGIKTEEIVIGSNNVLNNSTATDEESMQVDIQEESIGPLLQNYYLDLIEIIEEEEPELLEGNMNEVVLDLNFISPIFARRIEECLKKISQLQPIMQKEYTLDELKEEIELVNRGSRDFADGEDDYSFEDEDDYMPELLKQDLEFEDDNYAPLSSPVSARRQLVTPVSKAVSSMQNTQIQKTNTSPKPDLVAGGGSDSSSDDSDDSDSSDTGSEVSFEHINRPSLIVPTSLATKNFENLVNSKAWDMNELEQQSAPSYTSQYDLNANSGNFTHPTTPNTPGTVSSDINDPLWSDIQKKSALNQQRVKERNELEEKKRKEREERELAAKQEEERLKAYAEQEALRQQKEAEAKRDAELRQRREQERLKREQQKQLLQGQK